MKKIQVIVGVICLIVPIIAGKIFDVFKGLSSGTASKGVKLAKSNIDKGAKLANNGLDSTLANVKNWNHKTNF